jgi:hypothetical protein
MVSKTSFIIGAGVGYVLGTKAGRERFEQMKHQTHDLWASPSVQNAKGNAQSQASKLLDDGKHAMNERMHKSQTNEKAPGNAFNAES